MNILFLTMNPFTDLNMHNIYSDLMMEFVEHGHRPYIVTPREKKSGEVTECIDFDTYSLLKVRIGNTSGVSLIEKGISTVTLSSLYYSAVKKHLGHIKFDLILYSTPPITLAAPIKKLKKHFGCPTYLMLKDIFPQNAVDLGMFKKNGLIYRYFRGRERLLYKLSDRIGCMSPANVEYLLKHNPKIDGERVEICPNGIRLNQLKRTNAEARAELKNKLNISESAKVYLYGGNLGKPQCVPFIIECLKVNMNKDDRYFIICGNGSEYGVLESFVNEFAPNNVKLINGLPKAEYDALITGCDVGLIFLDHRFTIPNFPSRMLSYMENEMPIIACTDAATDVGTIISENGYGMRCESNDVASFTKCIDEMNDRSTEEMGKKAKSFLEENYTAKICYRIIMGEK